MNNVKKSISEIVESTMKKRDKILTRTRSCKNIVELLSRCVTTLVPITLPKYALFKADNALKGSKSLFTWNFFS